MDWIIARNYRPADKVTEVCWLCGYFKLGSGCCKDDESHLVDVIYTCDCWKYYK